MSYTVTRPLLHRPEDVAALLNVARTKVYRWLSTGELGSITIDRSRRIPDEELLQFVDRLRGAEHVNDPDGMTCAACGKELVGDMYALLHYTGRERRVLEMACSEEHLRDYLTTTNNCAPESGQA